MPMKNRKMIQIPVTEDEFNSWKELLIESNAPSARELFLSRVFDGDSGGSLEEIQEKDATITRLETHNEELTGKLQDAEVEIAELTQHSEANKRNMNKTIEGHEKLKGSSIIIPVTQKQREIIVKCYDNPEDLPKEILKDIVKTACTYVTIVEPGFFDDGQVGRFFLKKEVTGEDFQDAFEIEIAQLEAEGRIE